MALTDDERAYWRKQADSGVSTDQIVASIKAQRAGAPAAPPAGAPTQPAQESPSVLSQIAQPFKDIGSGLLKANDFAARAITHPVDTLGTPEKRGAALREGMRGVNSNIPFANSAVEAMGGPPAESPQDAALAPGANALGNVAGLPVGGAVGEIGARAIAPVAGAIGRGVQGVARGALDRMAVRGTEDLGVGAGKSARRGLEQKADEIGEAMAERPALRKAAAVHAATGEGKLLLSEADKLAKTGSTTLDRIYADAAKPGYTPPDFAPAVTGEAEQAVTPLKGGVPTASVAAKLNSRIAGLREGNAVENKIADHLEGIRDELHGRIGTDGVVDPKKLRHEQSGYQQLGKYGKGTAAEAAVAQANQMASEATGDALLEHVTGMPYADAVEFAKANPESVAAQVLHANGQITAAMRINKAVEGRAGSNPGAPNRLTALLHGMKHFGTASAAGAATHFGHPGLGGALVAADVIHSAMPKIGRAVDPIIAKLVKQGIDEQWSPAKLAAAISKAAPAENTATNLQLAGAQ
jgi:hypothetical protein